MLGPTSMRCRALRGGVLACAAMLALSACAQQGDDGAPPPKATHTVVTHPRLPLPTIAHQATSWPAPKMMLVGNTIVVGGTSKSPTVRSTKTKKTYNVSPLRADSAVSTRGGIYFLNAGELWFLGSDGAESTGFVGLTRVIVSADGRYLGLVDRNHGPSLPGKGELAAAVVYDVTTGSAIIRSSVGMGKTSDDLERIYAAQPPVPITFRDDSYFVSTPSGTFRYPLGGGTPSKVS